MIKHVRRRVAGQRDAGIALVVAISLIGLVSVLMLTMVAYALRETGASGRDRQRSSAVSAAEGQVDLTLARIQQASPATLPCGAQPAVSSQQSAADSISVTTTVTYYNAAEAVVACPSVPTTAVVSAKVSSTAVSAALAGQTPARRTIESLIRLTAEFDNGLDKAIFGDAGVDVKNNSDILAEPGPPNADIYTNGNFSCENQEQFHGSIYARGRIDLPGKCTVDVDVHAGTELKGDDITIGGQALVTGGKAILDKTTVARPVRASSTISWDGCTPTKCFPGSPVAPVPAQTFPPINWVGAEAAWAAAGYSNVVMKTACSGTNSALQWIQNNAQSTTRGKTVLVTACKISFSGTDILLGDDLAVFASGGYDFSNDVNIRSTSGARRRLHLIHPYNAVSTHPCTATGMSFNNKVTVESSVDLLAYSPCTILFKNNATIYGQVYGGGKVDVSNSLTLTYRSLPVYGVAPPVGGTARSYALDTVYKRENR